MQTDLSIRLHAYAHTAEAQIPVPSSLCPDALASSRAANAAASAAIICSHTRVLRAEPVPDYLLPGQDELDVLIAGKPKLKLPEDQAEPASHTPAQVVSEPAGQTAPHRLHLPLRPGSDSMASLILGAAGIPAIKTRNG